MMKAERLYEETTGSLRQWVDRLITEFDLALRTQDKLTAERARKKMLQELELVEYEMTQRP